MHDPEAQVELVAAFLHGCEEESVPAIAVSTTGSAEALARAAAEQSEISIGAGLDRAGCCALHDHRLGARDALIECHQCHKMSQLELRGLGVTAGRLVRGRPIPEEMP
jgi:hypothetical protein